jgi:hypothetical protein
VAGYRRSCAKRRGVVSQLPQGQRGRSPTSPKQINDQLLRLLIVAENLRSHTLDARQVLDYLRVLALSSVGKRSLNVNLAAAAHETRREAVGVDRR